ncbi:MAG: hypothetical protein Q9223_003937 [Gallowayella weberi]
MELPFHLSSTGILLLIALWILAGPSRCLPTTTLGAYVTEMSNGQVQVQRFSTSNPGTITSLSVVPTQTKLLNSDSTNKAYIGLTGTSASTRANGATVKDLSSLSVSVRTQPTQLDEAQARTASKTRGTTDHETKTQVSMPQSPDRPHEVIQTSRSAVEQDTVAPFQNADDGIPSTGGQPLAPGHNSTNPISTKGITSAQSSFPNDNRATQNLSSLPTPSGPELHTFSGISGTVMSGTGTSSPTTTTSPSKTNGFKPLGKAPFSNILGQTDPEDQGDLPITSDMPAHMSSTDTAGLTAQTRDSAVGSPAKLTPPPQTPVSTGPSSAATLLTIPASMKGVNTTNTSGAKGSIDVVEASSATSLAGASSNRKPTLAQLPPGPPRREEVHKDDDKDKGKGDEDDDNRDDQQSTTSDRPSSTETTSTAGTQTTLIMNTAYIDIRPTDVRVQDGDVKQYLLAAYSSIDIADDQFDSNSTVAATTTVSPSNLGNVSTTPSDVSNPTIDSSSITSSVVPSSTGGKTEEAPPTQSPDSLKCHGVAGDTWMIHRDQAVSAAEIFCKQDDSEKDVDQVKLSLSSSNADTSKPISKLTDCVDKFKLIIDSCDGDSPVNNPHNYKFGGTYFSSGWEYKLEPQAHKPTENSCDVSYRVAEDKFEIRGKNFRDGKLGPNGEGLKKEIKGCGALTFWNFIWTPNDVKYQWYASGVLPIGTKSCVGSATQSAGGKEAGHCRGPG